MSAKKLRSVRKRVVNIDGAIEMPNGKGRLRVRAFEIKAEGPSDLVARMLSEVVEGLRP